MLNKIEMTGPEILLKTLIKLFVLLLLLSVSAEAWAAGDSYDDALRLFKGRDYNNVVVYLERYIAKRPDAAAYYMLGYSCYKLREFSKSREYFNEAFLIDPGFTYDKIFEHSVVWDEELELIHEVLETSGTKEQLAYYAKAIGNCMPLLQGYSKEQKIGEELPGLIRESYRPDKIYPSVVQVFLSRFQKEYLMSVLSWLKTPVGQKMTKLATDANSTEGFINIRAFAGDYQKLGENRKKLLQRFEKAVSATDMNVEIVSVSLIDMLVAIQSQVDGKKRLSPGRIDSIVGKIRDIPGEQVKNNVMVSMACAFRDLSDEELGAVIQFYETPAGRWFRDIRNKAIASAIGKSSREFGEKLGKSLMAKDVPI